MSSRILIAAIAQFFLAIMQAAARLFGKGNAFDRLLQTSWFLVKVCGLRKAFVQTLCELRDQ